MPLAVARAIRLGTLAVGVSGLTLLAYSEAPTRDSAPLASSGERVAGPARIQAAAGAFPMEASASGPAADIVAASPGRMLFQAKGCGGCHALAGVSTSGIGPDLANLPRVAARRIPGYSAEAYVRESILDPQAFVVLGFGSVQMPRLPVTEREVDALVVFLLAK